jgi:hypothetical protein
MDSGNHIHHLVKRKDVIISHRERERETEKRALKSDECYTLGTVRKAHFQRACEACLRAVSTQPHDRSTGATNGRGERQANTLGLVAESSCHGNIQVIQSERQFGVATHLHFITTQTCTHAPYTSAWFGMKRWLN